MSFIAQLIHTCNILRPVAGGEDKLGNASQELIDVAGQVPCRLVEKEELVVRDERAAGTVITSYKLLLLPSTDIQERDTITQIKFEDGQVVQSEFTVKQVISRRTNMP